MECIMLKYEFVLEELKTERKWMCLADSCKKHVMMMKIIFYLSFEHWYFICVILCYYSNVCYPLYSQPENLLYETKAETSRLKIGNLYVCKIFIYLFHILFSPLLWPYKFLFVCLYFKSFELCSIPIHHFMNLIHCYRTNSKASICVISVI